MSLLLGNSSTMCRQFGLGLSTKIKVLSSLAHGGHPLAPSTVIPLSVGANSEGRPFTAKYYYFHSLARNSVNVNLSPSSSSAVVVSKRGMSAGGDHVTLWTVERVLALGLVPLLPLAIISPCAPFDYLLAFALTLHGHWGIEAVVHDYVRESVVGPVLPKVAIVGVYALSALTLGGLIYFSYADVGLGQAVRMLWKL